MIPRIAICVGTLLYASIILGAESLCRKDEINFSSCSVGTKTSSFCVSRGASTELAYIQYRFGMPRKVELVVPNNSRKSKGVFFNSMYTDGTGSEMRLSFKNGIYSYIFFNIDSWQEGDSVSRGIYVLKNSVLIKKLPCENPTSDHTPIPEGLIGNENFLFFK